MPRLGLFRPTCFLSYVGIFGVYKERYISMDAQGRIVTFERSSLNSSNDAVNNNELPRQDCTVGFGLALS